MTLPISGLMVYFQFLCFSTLEMAGGMRYTFGVWPFLLVMHPGTEVAAQLVECFRSLCKAPDRVSTVSKLAVVHTSNPKTQKAEAGDQKCAFIPGFTSFRPAWET